MENEAALVPLAAAVIAAWCAAIWMAAVVFRRRRAGLPVPEPRPQRPVPWRGADVIAAVAIMLLARIAVQGIFGEAEGMTSQLLASVTAMLGGAVAVAIFLRLRGGSWRDLGLVPVRPMADLRIAVAGLGLVLAPLLAVAAALNRIVPYTHPIIDYLAEHREPVAIGLVVLAAVVVAPLAEEFLFRRVLQGWLATVEPLLGPGSAIGLSSLAFAAAHAGHGLGWMPLLALGAVLGVIVRQTGSIVPAVLLHALFNAVSVVLLLLQISGLAPAEP